MLIYLLNELNTTAGFLALFMVITIILFSLVYLQLSTIMKEEKKIKERLEDAGL